MLTFKDWMFLDVSGCFSFFVAMIRLSAHDGGAFFFVVHIITAVSPWQDYPQAYNVGTVGSQRCGPTSTAEDGIPADGSLGEIKEEALADKTRIIQDWAQ